MFTQGRELPGLKLKSPMQFGLIYISGIAQGLKGKSAGSNLLYNAVKGRMSSFISGQVSPAKSPLSQQRKTTIALIQQEGGTTGLAYLCVIRIFRLGTAQVQTQARQSLRSLPKWALTRPGAAWPIFPFLR